RYGNAVWKKLAELAVCAGLEEEGEDWEHLAKALISAIEEKNRKYKIPDHIDAIQEEDIRALAKYADQEANPLYPVPVLWNAKELEEIYREVKG
ncbi:MAG: iron-containing alcohol dehydrogenase, partial [Lachnospiraceae bacterium]|nr:iron-containing alcohol dehydrogenase [Lachnospiraceae bacterium]